MNWREGVSLDLKLGGRMLVKYPGLTIVGGLAIGQAGLILMAIGVGCVFLAIAFFVYSNRMDKEKNNGS